MAEIPKYVKVAVGLVSVLTLSVWASVFLSRRNDGSLGYLSDDPFVDGPIYLYEKNNADMKLHVAGGGVQIDNWSLSPRGDRLAYTIDGIPLSLHIVNVNGQKDWIVSSNISVNQPDWSPDGKQIVFSGWDNGKIPPSIWIVNTDPSNPNLQLLSVPESNSNQQSPEFSPDGNKIVYVNSMFTNNQQGTNNQIWMMDKDGTNKNLLLTIEAGSVDYLSWSPDGKKLVFTSAYADNNAQPLENNREDMYVFNVESRSSVKLTPDKNGAFVFNDTNPVWSPDGSKILYQEYVQNTDNTNSYTDTFVYTINPDGSNKNFVSADQFADNFKWTPDGNITFSSLKGGKRYLYVQNMNTGEIKSLKEGESGMNDPVFVK